MIGQPKYFDVNHYLESVKMMVRADEVIRALNMLDNLPGYYRENEPKEVTELRNEILSKVETVVDYTRHDLEHLSIAEDYEKQQCDARARDQGKESDYEDLGDMIKDDFCYPRGPMVLKIVESLNSKGISPHIAELGPANYWLPHGLKKLGKSFKYKPISVNRVAEASHIKSLGDTISHDINLSGVKMFVCFEVLEHMWNEKDLLFEYKKLKHDFDVIAISTPLYTYGGGEAEKQSFEHIRTYTAKEFSNLVKDFFPGLTWFHAQTHSQVMLGATQEMKWCLEGLENVEPLG